MRSRMTQYILRLSDLTRKAAGMERYNVHDEYMTPSEAGNVVLHADAQRALDALQAQLAAEQHRADRAVQDRRDVLDVKTKEGMSCSEWLMRTATAERQVNELKAQLWQVEEALDEALGALGYPVPADTPSPGRYKCGLCEAAALLSAAGKQTEVK